MVGDPPVGDLLRPRREQVVQLLQRLDAVVGGLGQERLPDIPVQPFLLPPPFREYGREWTRRMPSTAQVLASHALLKGAPLSA